MRSPRAPTEAPPGPAAVRAYNWLQGGRRRPLEPDTLRARAARLTGLADWGDDRAFGEGLGAVTDGINGWPDLSPWGRRVLEGMLLQALSTRLRLRERMRTEPAVFAQPVSRPVFVVGLARTGTTFLQRLLAQDPAARTTLFWEAQRPFPAPRPETYERDGRILAARIELAVTRYLNPALGVLHPTRATWPDEDLPLLLRGLGFPWVTLVANPTLFEWFIGSRPWYLPAVYRHHRAELQHLQSRFGVGHWLLKSPVHTWGLTALLQTYPDARVVQTHRDPQRVVPSACRLWHAIRAGLETRVVVSRLGEEMLSRWTPLLAEILAARTERPATARFHDVHYARLVADPVGTARGIYEAFDLAWDVTLERRMAAFVADERQARRTSPHRATPEQFGLRAARIEEAFQAYRERFGGEPERE